MRRRAVAAAPPQALTVTWARLIELLTAQSSELLEHIRPPAAPETVAEAEQRLQRTLPQDLRQLYSLADGFVAWPYLLRDDYRLLPLDEMVEASLALVGEPVVLDELAGEVYVAKTLIRLVVAQAKEDDPDISQVTMRLWQKKQPTMEAWYRAGGIHVYEEVVDWQGSLLAWLEGCLEYYH